MNQVSASHRLDPKLTIQIYQRYATNPADILQQPNEDEPTWRSRINPDRYPVASQTYKFLQSMGKYSESEWRKKFHHNIRTLNSKIQAGPEKVREKAKAYQNKHRTKAGTPGASAPTRDNSLAPQPLNTSVFCLHLDKDVLVGGFMPAESESVCWRGDQGSELHFCLPYLPNAVGINEVEPANEYLKALMKTPFIERSNDYVVRMEPHEIPSSAVDLLDIIGNALAKNQVVHLVGFDQRFSQASSIPWSNAIIQARGVSEHRHITIHSLRDNIKYHQGTPSSECMRTYQSTVTAFLEGMKDHSRIEAVLSVNMQGLTFNDVLSDMNDLMLVSRNMEDQHRESAVKMAVVHLAWALLHQAGYLTLNHEDAGGDVSGTLLEQGCKIWTFYFRTHNHRSQHVTETIRLCNEALKPATLDNDNIKVVTIVLLPGDVQ
ncbi:hypothetical protein VNI00_000421 [Paramarasmius palmivorus]|uniref:Clr5 domain-containing protein n=1 Tax=Paramarasmius palmivorus TaxID=297713 RepID=A0AAW0ECC7_9AGAR